MGFFISCGSGRPPDALRFFIFLIIYRAEIYAGTVILFHVKFTGFISLF